MFSLAKSKRSDSIYGSFDAGQSDSEKSQSIQLEYYDEDEIDLASWNPENIPLLRRTIDQAKSLGVKRTLSWFAGNQYLPEAVEPDDLDKPWTRLRKFKVFVLTILCISITVLLLFLPEEMANMNIVTVQEHLDYTIDIDDIIKDGGITQDSLLEVTIRGSFVRPELTSLAKDTLQISLELENNATGNSN